tara:strand:- start:1398 stop:1937 length:540 start_codon:yes stop_codon:yes gene_type:complete
MILGLDISTSITGATILDKDGKIIYNDAWDTRKFKTMFAKAEYVKEKLLDAFENSIDDSSVIKHIYIEQNLQSFRSGFSSAKTLSTLSKFNGIVSWMCYDLLEITPEYVAAPTARKLAGIKIPRGTKAKEVVLKYVEQEGLLEIEYTKHGNPKPQFYDRADSIIIAKAGHYLLQEKDDE